MELMEALALATHVLAADDAGGMREIAQHAGGVQLARVGDPALFAEAVVEALGEGESAAKKECSSAFLKTFGVESVTAQYETLLDGLTYLGSVG